MSRRWFAKSATASACHIHTAAVLYASSSGASQFSYISKGHVSLYFSLYCIVRRILSCSANPNLQLYIPRRHHGYKMYMQ